MEAMQTLPRASVPVAVNENDRNTKMKWGIKLTMHPGRR